MDADVLLGEVLDQLEGNIALPSAAFSVEAYVDLVLRRVVKKHTEEADYLVVHVVFDGAAQDPSQLVEADGRRLSCNLSKTSDLLTPSGVFISLTMKPPKDG